MKVLRSCSRVCVSIALVAGVGLGITSCAAEPDEPASAEPAVAEPAAAPREASSLAVPAAGQVTFVCINLDDGELFGRPLGTLAACQAVCPAPAVCLRCVGNINDCI